VEGTLDGPRCPALLADEHALLGTVLAGRVGAIGHARHIEGAADGQALDPRAVLNGQRLPGIVLDHGVVFQDVIDRNAIRLLEANGAQHAFSLGHDGHGLPFPA